MTATGVSRGAGEASMNARQTAFQAPDDAGASEAAPEDSLDHAILRTAPSERASEAQGDPARRRLRFRRPERTGLLGPFAAAVVCWAIFASLGMAAKEKALQAERLRFVSIEQWYQERLTAMRSSMNAMVELCKDYGCPNSLIGAATTGAAPAPDPVRAAIEAAVRDAMTDPAVPDAEPTPPPPLTPTPKPAVPAPAPD